MFRLKPNVLFPKRFAESLLLTKPQEESIFRAERQGRPYLPGREALTGDSRQRGEHVVALSQPAAATRGGGRQPGGAPGGMGSSCKGRGQPRAAPGRGGQPGAVVEGMKEAWGEATCARHKLYSCYGRMGWGGGLPDHQQSD